MFHGGGSVPVGAGPTLPDCEASRAARRRLGEDQVLLCPRQEDIAIVNAALLRRPLLVTGLPGVGKVQLAYLIARELGLGPVTAVGIVSRTALKEGAVRLRRHRPCPGDRGVACGRRIGRR
ncbi:hypothetical protein [Streptomyces sp. KL116D]|uniref:hypothetical protein n=1 Tax=Streptomyces sp. KL116D TaxID=3045152 RepID=UPI003555EC11